MRGVNVASIKEVWEVLDGAKHRFMEGDLEGATKEAVRAARGALSLLVGAKPALRGDVSLTALYRAVGGCGGEDDGWGFLVLRCVELLEGVEVRGSAVAGCGVEDVLACAEEVVNWVEALLARGGCASMF